LDKYIDQAGGAQNITVIHGAAKGADTLASDWCKLTGAMEERYPADWDSPCENSCNHFRVSHPEHRYYSCAGWVRNQKMVNLGADVCIAFPRGISKGTRDCIRRAEAAGIPVIYE